jgi:release factor glutamine methyltransferase
VENPRLDVEILMAHALGLERIDLYLQYDRPLTDEELEALRPLIRARGGHEPVAYLVGERAFYELTFRVDANVLVPRPETEHLVDCAIVALEDRPAATIVDVGTGSGCVAISVLHALPSARALATDISAGALGVARDNAERHGVLDRLELLEGHLLEPLAGRVEPGSVDAVLSNPPYVVRGDPTLAPDVRAHEPEAALYVPGDDPLEVFRVVAEGARSLLRPGGLLAMEVGMGSADEARGVLADLGYDEVGAIRDLAGIDRVVRGERA